MMSPIIIIITGALEEIDRATALAFAREGARTVVSGRHVAQTIPILTSGKARSLAGQSITVNGALTAR